MPSSSISPCCVVWAQDDNAAAKAAGWSFFDVGLGRLQVQSDDEAGILTGDSGAWAAVLERSALNTKALSFLQQNNPGEWLRIVAGAGADERELVIVSAGYRILDNGTGWGWYALLPGATEFQAAEEYSGQADTYLGFFSSKADLVEEVYASVIDAILADSALTEAEWDMLHIDNKMGEAWSLRPVEAIRMFGGRKEGSDF